MKKMDKEQLMKELDESKMMFGKHKGKFLGEVIQEDMKYLQWLACKDNSITAIALKFYLDNY